MKLSIVIVNYNVKFFLEQCLLSVQKAIVNIDAEVFVVDNNSIDGSVAMLEERFPWVISLPQKENLGFSKGNNVAMKQAKGEYILLLNPDTLVQEDSFEKVLSFMDNHPNAGGLGVKMIDGKGNFLPESKRGLPTPEVAFYKIFGLSALFPKNKRFGKYHLSFLSKDKNHEVAILSGAFMLMRKKVLDEIGLLDEAFFMYGEDIDLSYRITQAGYKNYYFSETSIIHYKGESTKKSSVNYVFVFYKAMIIFAEKHFSGGSAKLFGSIIQAAIYLRASVALVRRLLASFFIPLADMLLFGIVFSLIALVYQNLNDKIFTDEFYYINLPVYVVLWLISIFFSGGYDLPLKFKKAFQGLVAGLLLVLIVYGLLPEGYRFSRFLVFLFGVATLPLSFINRWTAAKLFPEKISFLHSDKKRVGIVGEQMAISKVVDILNYSHISPDFVAKISPDHRAKPGGNYIGNISQIREIIEIFKLHEIIFCAQDVSANEIIEIMNDVSNEKIEFKIAPPESIYVIGSSSVNRSGEFYSILNANSINSKESVRNKWIIDKLLCIIAFVLLPYTLIGAKNFKRILKGIIDVLIGTKTWIAYNPNDEKLNMLPKLKSGVFSCSSHIKNRNMSSTEIHQLNLGYAKSFSIYNDLVLFFKNL